MEYILTSILIVLVIIYITHKINKKLNLIQYDIDQIITQQQEQEKIEKHLKQLEETINEFGLSDESLSVEYGVRNRYYIYKGDKIIYGSDLFYDTLSFIIGLSKYKNILDGKTKDDK